MDLKEKKNFLFYYNHAEEIILFIMMVVMVVVIFLQVVMRYAFNNSLSWSEELGRYLFVWLSWLGVSLGARYGQHIKMEFFITWLPYKTRMISLLLSDVIVLGVCFVLLLNGVRLVDQLIAIGAESAALHINRAWGYASVPVGAGLMIARTLQSMWNSVKNFKLGEQVEGGSQ